MTKQIETTKSVLEVGVKVFLRRSDGKYLILKRAHPYYGQQIRKWDIPGGRISPGETVLTALKREVQEETKLKINKILNVLTVQDILRVPGKHTIRITYLATCANTDQVKIDFKEHSDYRWVSLKEFQKVRHDLYVTEVIEKLLKEK